jgi:hypothetical protein
MSIFFRDLDNRLSEEVPKRYEYSTPESRSEKGDRDKRYHPHTKYPCRDRDEMTNDGYESSDKCVDLIILEKEFFCLLIFLFRDEDILPIAFEKWFSEPSTEDIVVRKCAYHRAKSSDKSRKKWIDISCYCRYSCGYHDELRWHRNDRRFHCHKDEYIEISYSTEVVKK